MAYKVPEGKVIDYERIGKKGFPMHWEALGLEPPLTDAPVAEAPIVDAEDDEDDGA